MNISFWEKETFLSRADATIVGAGLVGLSAAIFMKEQAADKRVIVLEAGPWPGAASLRNAGFACFGSPSELIDDLSTRPGSEVAALVQKRKQGLARLRSIAGDDGIAYVDSPAYEVFAPGQEALMESCLARIGELNKLIETKSSPQHYAPAEPPEGTKGFLGTIKIMGEGQIHPGKMMKSLEVKARNLGVEIHYGWPVSEIRQEAGKHIIIGEKGMQLQSMKVLIATNGFSLKLLPQLALRPARNQVLITKPIPGLKIKGNFHARAGYVYFRNVGNRLLIGGFRNLDPDGETTMEAGFTSTIQDALSSFVDTFLLEPGSWEIDQRWSGILGVGDSKSPILEEIEPGLWCAVRLGGMGVALGAGLGADAAKKVLE